MKTFKLTAILLMMAGGFYSCTGDSKSSSEFPEGSTQKQTGDVNHPLPDLPWLKAKVDEITLLSQSNSMRIAIYQCTYGDGNTGFLIDQGNIKPFYNYNGDVLCTMGGAVGETCSELNIDFENKQLIWRVENGFVNGICEFDNPLEDLLWLREIVEELTIYSNSVAKRHFMIYQCTYTEEGGRKVGFIVTPLCVDCRDGTAMLYRCTGTKICSMGGTAGAGACDHFNIANKKLIWEIK